MALVRRAALEDMPRIMELIQEFNDNYHDVPINPAKAIAVSAWIIEDGVGFISDSGFIGGVVADDLLRDWTVLHELGWFSKDRSGTKLLDAFITAGFELGVNEVRVCALETSSPIVGRLLQRKGFAPLEVSYRLMTGA